MKKILITGAGSYIGTSFERWGIRNHPAEIQTDTVDMIDGSWKEKDFTGYDVVFHVAAIVHKKETPEMRDLYQKVNTELPIAVAEKAKKEGVAQFVFMSTMNVYGVNVGEISRATKPTPKTFYGKSKLNAENRLRKLQDSDFQVAILRPPMVYGEGCRGNYQTLKRFAEKSPVFPKWKNQRSSLSVEKLCEILYELIQNGSSGLFLPQDDRYACTYRTVQELAEKSEHKICCTAVFNPLIHLALVMRIPVMEKVFGNLIYVKE